MKLTTISRCGFAAIQCGEAPPQYDPLISEAVPPYGRAKPYRIAEVQSHRGRRLYSFRSLAVLVVLFSLASCNATQRQIGIPAEAQATIDAVTENIANGSDDKIYQEAAEEWRQASTLEQTREFFKTLRTKLGKMKSRTFQMARGEQSKTGTPQEQTYVVQYQSVFERGEGMETYTLVERDKRWLLARYFVNSDALK